MDLHLIVNHWKSKSQDTLTVEHTLPRRTEQAAFVAGLIDEIRSAHPDARLMVLGDLNDFFNSVPLSMLKNARLLNLTAAVPKAARYTFIFRGVSQVLDHIFVSPNLHNQTY